MLGVLAIDAAVTYRMALADGPIDIAPHAPGHSSGRGQQIPNASQDGCHGRHATFRPPFRKPTKCARPGWLHSGQGRAASSCIGGGAVTADLRAVGGNSARMLAPVGECILLRGSAIHVCAALAPGDVAHR